MRQVRYDESRFDPRVRVPVDSKATCHSCYIARIVPPRILYEAAACPIFPLLLRVKFSPAVAERVLFVVTV